MSIITKWSHKFNKGWNGQSNMSLCAAEEMKKQQGKANMAWMCNIAFGKGHTENALRNHYNRGDKLFEDLDRNHDIKPSVTDLATVVYSLPAAALITLIFSVVPQEYKIDGIRAKLKG